jgi:hypothetical protein
MVAAFAGLNSTVNAACSGEDVMTPSDGLPLTRKQQQQQQQRIELEKLCARFDGPPSTKVVNASMSSAGSAMSAVAQSSTMP